MIDNVVSISDHYNLVRVPSGFIVVKKDTDEPIIDPQGQVLLFHRIRDAQRRVNEYERNLVQWKEAPPDPGLPERHAQQKWWQFGYR